MEETLRPGHPGDDAPYAPALPRDVRANPIRSGADWRAMREACRADPGAFHGRIAAATLHWYHPGRRAWLRRDDDGAWRGWAAADGAPVTLEEAWTPWRQALDDAEPPHYRWFVGGETNAAFNEVDRHVLAGHGDEPAYYYEGDRWDPAAHGGRGGPLEHRVLTRRELLIGSVVAARALQRLGLGQGDRVAFNLPNILEQIVWTEGAKRLGVIYTPVFGGFSAHTLADRIADAGARVVLTADGAHRNARLVPYKSAYTDPALARYRPVRQAADLVERRAGEAEPALAAALRRRVEAELGGEITVEPAEVMRAVGRELDARDDLPAGRAAALRTRLARALAAAPSPVERVVVIRHAGMEGLPWQSGRDVWAHDLLAEAERDLCDAAGVADGEALRALPDGELVGALWRSVPCRPVAADYPLFIIYTSGSTGKPKGVVHVHGGYVAGVAHTMAVSFDAVPGRDAMYVVADPGWITGQSYLITAALAARIPAVVAEGPPVYPHAGRFASIIERHRVTIFKAGVTFLKGVMAHPANRDDVRRHDLSSLRVATFCAEPTSPAVQRFGMELMTPQYINSYWATEHGGIVWTHPYGNPDQPLRADARTWPLPWVMGDVWVAEGEPEDDPQGEGRVAWRRAADGEQGEIVITAPYPYLARTVWGDGDRVNEPGWRGDAARFGRTYFGRFREPDGRPAWAYVQGDFARRYGDGSFSLHGRSDEVINVAGHRIGTEEIEGAVLKDRQLRADSPVGNCIVIGAPHPEKGLTPLALVQPAPGRRLGPEDERRLRGLVEREKGPVAQPAAFLPVPAFPETRSGKYMRRFVKAMVAGRPLGDTTTLRNPECLEDIRMQIEAWKRGQSRAAGQELIERWRFAHVRYDRVGSDARGEPVRVATLTVANPPVNSLSERVLDDLGAAVEHLRRRADVGAVVVCGSGTRMFSAGADVRQFLEQLTTVEQARALTGKAHDVFNRLEALQVPVIAAVHGRALGGGNELALACHFRVGDATTGLGQPEINLFLHPGYGGTQRLPRVWEAASGSPEAGTRQALAMMLSGRLWSGETLRASGLLDDLAAGARDVYSVAMAHARRAALTGEGPAQEAMRRRQDRREAWRRPGGFPEAVLDDADLQRYLRQAEGAGRGHVARTIVELVRRGREQGLDAGLAAEADSFAAILLDAENGGRKGLPLFFERRSPYLPARPRPVFDAGQRQALEARGELLPVGHPFVPGATPLPRWQYAHAVVRDLETGAPRHAEPSRAEEEAVVPVPEPGPDQALLYVLASEVNFNDSWALTGIPVSLFDAHDEDVHITGSGGIALVAGLGANLQAEGRLQVGDLVSVYSGIADLLDPEAGTDPMYTPTFRIQGYETPDGSHQQFMLADGPQCLRPPANLTLEQAGSYILPAGTVYRALHTTLQVQPGRRMLVEGAASGTGADAVRLGAAARLQVTGMVSSAERARHVEAMGGRAVDRKAPGIARAFGRIPAEPARWADWERAGEPFLEAVRAANDGHLVDYAVSHAGEASFPRTFQALAPGGSLTFYGATTGYYLTFLGKPGAAEPADMLQRAGLRAGEAVLVFYGTGGEEPHQAALRSIEAARAAGARIVVVTDSEAERDFVESLGYGEAVAGVVSLEAIRRDAPAFVWPETLPDLPDPVAETEAFRAALREFTNVTFKPLGLAVGRFFRSADNPRGQPDVIVERAGRDSLSVSAMIVKPNTGRVVYTEDMGGRRYSLYAPQVWMRQRRVLMPTANILGTHLCNAAEAVALNRMIETGRLAIEPPYLADWHELPGVHQAMWDNRLPEHTGGATKAMANHALPEPGLRTREELLLAWGL